MTVPLFFIYASKDGECLSQIEKQLATLVNNQILTYWHQGKLVAGSDWRAVTQSKLDNAEIVLPIVSADFLADTECMAWLQEADKRGKKIVPIIASSCLWEYDSILKGKTPLPCKDQDTKATPLNKWTPIADGYSAVVEGIMEVVDQYDAPAPTDLTTSRTTNKPNNSSSKNTNNMPTSNLVFENGYALLIGIRYGQYANTDQWKNVLNGTLNDVRNLKHHFTDPQKAAYKPENVIELTEENATQQGILDALDELAGRVGNDSAASVIITYSGHGLSEGLVPYNYQQVGAVSAKDFSEKIAAIKAKKLLVILDCCHSENLATTKGISTSDALDVLLRDINDQLDASETRAKGLTDEIAKGSGTVILTSCEANETSLDIGSNGLFTSVLLECLKGASNLKKDGWVRLIDLMDYVPKTVKERAEKVDLGKGPHQQNPMFKRIENLTSEDFIICAYDIAQARGDIKPPTPEPTSPSINPPKTNENNMSNIKTTVTNLIRNAKLQEALTFLAQQFPNNTEIAELQRRYNDNERNNRRGILDKRDYDRERNTITAALLDLLNEL